MAQQASGDQATRQSDSAEAHFESHGHSVAAWILVAFELVGSFIISLGIVLVTLWLDIVGIAFCLVGFIVGRVLQMAGFGVHPPGVQAH